MLLFRATLKPLRSCAYATVPGSVVLSIDILGLSRSSGFYQHRSLHSPSTASVFDLRPENRLLDVTQHLDPLPPPESLRILPRFINKQDQATLSKAADKKLNRSCGRKYWTGHFDGVTSNYRECSWTSLGSEDTAVIDILNGVKAEVERILGDSKDGLPEKWLPWHLLDLDKTGEIRFHVDNVQASGSIVVGICLLSPAMIIFRKAADPKQRFGALLEPGTVYFQRNELRYNYEHSIPLDHLGARMFRNILISKGRRISIMLRDSLHEHNPPRHLTR